MPAAPAAIVTSGAPRLKIENPRYEYGLIWDFADQPGQMTVTNVGDETLIINDVNAGCSCTKATMDDNSLAPGESGTLNFLFSPNSAGDQTKKIKLVSNDPRSPVTEVQFSAQVRRFVLVQPDFVRVGDVRRGVPHTVTATLTPSDPDYTIESMKFIGQSAAYLSPKEIDSGDPRSRVIEVTIAPEARWGALSARLEVTGKGTIAEGEDPRKHVFFFFVTGTVSGELKASQPRFSIGTFPPSSPFSTALTLSRVDGTPFLVTNAVISGGNIPMTVTSTPVGDGSTWSLLLQGSSGSVTGPVRGDVLIQTNVPGEDLLSFRITGLVR
jgi:hypothetical protein